MATNQTRAKKKKKIKQGRKRKFVQFFTREIERIHQGKRGRYRSVVDWIQQSRRSHRCPKVNKRAIKRARVSPANNVIGDRAAAAFERVACRLIGKLPVWRFQPAAPSATGLVMRITDAHRRSFCVQMKWRLFDHPRSFVRIKYGKFRPRYPTPLFQISFFVLSFILSIIHPLLLVSRINGFNLFEFFAQFEDERGEEIPRWRAL